MKTPILWGDHLAWSACEGLTCRVLHYDLGRDGRFGTADDFLAQDTVAIDQNGYDAVLNCLLRK